MWLGIFLLGISAAKLPSAAGQTFELNVTCPIDSAQVANLHRVERWSVHPKVSGDQSQNGGCGCLPVGPAVGRQIVDTYRQSPHEQAMDTLFAELKLDNEKLYGSILVMDSKFSEQIGEIRDLASQVARLRTKGEQNVKYLQEVGASIETLREEHAANQRQLKSMFTRNAKAYSKQMAELAANLADDDQELRNDLGQTVSALQKVTRSIVELTSVASGNSNGILDVIRDSDKWIGALRSDLETNSKLLRKVSKAVNQSQRQLKSMADQTEDRLLGLQQDQKSLNGKFGELTTASTAGKASLEGLKKRFDENVASNDGAIRAVERELRSLKKKLAEFEKQQQRRKKHWESRFSQLDRIETSLDKMISLRAKKKKSKK